MGDLNHWAKGDRIGPFTVQRKIGEGWEAVVLLVLDKRDGKLRTLKLFKRTNVLPEVIHTFQHWQRFAGLDCVKQCLEWGVLTGQRRVSERPWMLMEYIPGVTLAEKIKHGHIKDPVVLSLNLLRMLAPIHARKLSWGDADYGRNLIIERGTGRFIVIDLDAGGPTEEPPAIYDDLIEVLRLVRRCSSTSVPSKLARLLEQAPDAAAVLKLLQREDKALK